MQMKQYGRRRCSPRDLADHHDINPHCACARRVMWNTPVQDLEEMDMPDKDDQRYRKSRPNSAPRCALCDGDFGLIRHYRCGTALCSIKCVERFQLRRESDSRWLAISSCVEFSASSWHLAVSDNLST
jgi:hypothetical protein